MGNLGDKGFNGYRVYREEVVDELEDMELL
jgi:hypothetical protein